MEDRFIEVNYNSTDGVTRPVRPMSLKLLPEPIWGHILAINKEFLLAVSRFLDQVISKMKDRGKISCCSRRTQVNGSEEKQE